MFFRKILLKIFSHRTLALLRWDFHLATTRLRNLFLIGNKVRLSDKIKKSVQPLYLNLGCGPRGLNDNHWINVDAYPDINVHFRMDLTRKFPFPADYVNGIYCEHVFEHFDMEQGQVLLRECLRILRSGGCVRFIVPDGEKIMQTYFDDPGDLLIRRDCKSACAMEAVNSYFRQRYEHQCLYDWKLLEYQLRQAGFINILKVSFKKGSFSQPIMLDDEKYEWESLYVEAAKP